MAVSLQSTKQNFVPTRECEVFVYKIPRSVSEQELVSMFEKYGDIYKLRLVRQDNNGNNYAFVRFTEKSSVKVAVLLWNGYEIRNGQRISVCRSIENKSLVLCSVPKYLSSRDIYYLITLYTTGLHEVYVQVPRDQRSVNSGIAVLRYETHTHACIAKRILGSVRNFLWNQQVHVEWYTPGLKWDDNRPPITSSAAGQTSYQRIHTQTTTATKAERWSSKKYQDYVFIREIAKIRTYDENGY